MPQNLKDILSNLSTDIDQETLLLYLQDKLSDEQKHEVEAKLINDDFESDAVEGLDAIKDKEQIQYMVEMLNRDLKKKTEKEKAKRENEIERPTLALHFYSDYHTADCTFLYCHSSLAEQVISISFCLPNASNLQKLFLPQDAVRV
jgi:hypothetical protein